jgi:hypothetical protein
VVSRRDGFIGEWWMVKETGGVRVKGRGSVSTRTCDKAVEYSRIYDVYSLSLSISSSINLVIVASNSSSLSWFGCDEYRASLFRS